ncbi:hypothetical protein AYL99_04531 [Fonsecaea erecta]|uniref:Transcription factor domain-containing protein n=1 Tax=Fonsecaea erecta TaxID=1367422 RepID=A0A178ZR62_9EURO|nr:hypothetical protein AYL99_04531 [Fonsecaea erecta]OAP62328.1 hypothetical protein AYL99_04531 [Fonsecaea erecta]
MAAARRGSAATLCTDENLSTAAGDWTASFVTGDAPTAPGKIGPALSRSLDLDTPSSLSPASSRVARAFNVREDLIDSSMWHIFSSIFETALGVWLGGGCCPYPGLPDGSRTIISRLFVSLDEWKCPCRRHDGHAKPRSMTASSGNVCVKAGKVVNQALNAAVHAFSVRWLPLVAGKSISTEKLNDLARKLWHNARVKVLLILQKRCYRSILALYIFGMTPLPPGLEDHELGDGTIGEVCVDIAMRQLQTVRARRDVSRFSSAAIATDSVPLSAVVDTSPHHTVDEGYELRETIAYWAGFVFDTSASFTTGLPSILHASLLGFEQEQTVQLLKKTAQEFHEKTEDWRANGFEVTNQRAIWIVQSASGCKGVFWKAVAALREALNYGHEPHVVVRAQTAVLQCMLRYDVTYAPLLAACKRALLFLGFEAQLNWYLLALHYHLGLLMLYDTLDTFGRRDLVTNPDNAQWAAVQETINIILLGIQCKVSLQTVFGSTSSAPSRRDDMVCLLSVDPYPHHVATALGLVSDFLKKSSNEACTSGDALRQVRKVATMAFDQLPQCSASLQAARVNVGAKLEEVQQLHDGPMADNGKKSPSPGRQQHLQPESGGIHGSREEDFEAIDRLEIGTVHHAVENFAASSVDSQQTTTTTTTSGLVDQWDWTSSEDSPMSFEIPGDDMFLADHGLFESESVPELLSLAGAAFLLLLLEEEELLVGCWCFDVLLLSEQVVLCCEDGDDDDDEDDLVVDVVVLCWKRLAPVVLGVEFMDRTDLRAKKADAIACGVSWIVQAVE